MAEYYSPVGQNEFKADGRLTSVWLSSELSKYQQKTRGVGNNWKIALPSYNLTRTWLIVHYKDIEIILFVEKVRVFYLHA